MEYDTVSARASSADRIRVNHAAKRLGCTDRTVRRLIQHGKLPAERQGLRTWFILRSDVERLSRQREAAW
jgi:excisionase family DNA binding protein